jgi:hypothetical protein
MSISVTNNQLVYSIRKHAQGCSHPLRKNNLVSALDARWMDGWMDGAVF